MRNEYDEVRRAGISDVPESTWLYTEGQRIREAQGLSQVKDSFKRFRRVIQLSQFTFGQDSWKLNALPSDRCSVSWMKWVGLIPVSKEQVCTSPKKRGNVNCYSWHLLTSSLAGSAERPRVQRLWKGLTGPGTETDPLTSPCETTVLTSVPMASALHTLTHAWVGVI